MRVPAFQFSRRTVIAAIEVLEGQFSTHDSLERYLLKLNRDLAARCARGYLSAKFTALIKALMMNLICALRMENTLGQACRRREFVASAETNPDTQEKSRRI
jgi:hypothetical protein